MKVVKCVLSLMIIAIICCFATAAARADTTDVVPVIVDPVKTDFGTYQPEKVVVTPSVPLYGIESDLSNVGNADDFAIEPGTEKLLSENGFAATASGYRQIYDIYQENTENGVPSFVTTDACLHTYHILYDYVLRVVEKEYFMDDLANLLTAMISSMENEIEMATEPVVVDAALDDLAYLYVALGLLDPEAEIDDRVKAAVDEEIGLVMDLSNGYVPSPLFYSEDYPFVEDYSQYKPRGHYTRSEEFERYFRSMMWLGRITFSVTLPGASEEGLRQSAIRGLLVCKVLDNARILLDDSPARNAWTRIYEPTVFFVGEADDILHTQFMQVAAGVFGKSYTILSPDLFADEQKIDDFIEDVIAELPDPKITVKAGKGYRFMGQRFIPDSYVLDQMVEDFVHGRLMPRGLDVMAALGSQRAYDIVDTVYGDPSLYADYDPQLAKMRQELMELPVETWASNLYYNWLYSLTPLLTEKGEGYPLFMQNTAWADKALNTALGSWAELRHDTILYAKQSETFENSAPHAPGLVKGYVEPEPDVYARLAALADYTADGLAGQGLLDDMFSSRLADFAELMRSLKWVAVRELENSILSDGDYALICNFGVSIADLTSFPPEFEEQYENDADDYMAVIADIHTDPNFNECLEVGVGHPLTLYVIAPVNGVPTLTCGGMFSYHEFKRPLSKGRLTDEEWQELQSSPDAQDMPEWTGSFLDGKSSTGGKVFHSHGLDQLVTSVEDEKPEAAIILSAAPNPFNPATTISFSIAEAGPVRITVHNLQGQTVEVVVDEALPAGRHSYTWQPEGLGSGVYIVRLSTGGMSRKMKMLFLK